MRIVLSDRVDPRKKKKKLNNQNQIRVDFIFNFTLIEKKNILFVMSLILK